MKKTKKLEKKKIQRYCNAFDEIKECNEKFGFVKDATKIAIINNIDKNFANKLISLGILKRIKRGRYELLKPHLSSKDVCSIYFSYPQNKNQTKINFNELSDVTIKKIKEKKITKKTHNKFFGFIIDLMLYNGGKTIKKTEIAKIQKKHNVSKNAIGALLYSKVLNKENNKYKVNTLPKDMNVLGKMADDSSRYYSYITQTPKNKKIKKEVPKGENENQVISNDSSHLFEKHIYNDKNFNDEVEGLFVKEKSLIFLKKYLIISIICKTDKKTVDQIYEMLTSKEINEPIS